MWSECKQIAVLAAAIMTGSVQLPAGAWNQDAGHGQLIVTTSYFQTSQGFDGSGTTQPFSKQGQFRQININPYFEYGLTRRYALIINANAPLLRYANADGSATSAGLGDAEVGFKRRLNALESRWAVSGQLTFMFPAYSVKRNPAPGNHQEDVEGRLLVGRGTVWTHRNFFWDVEGAYRYRAGAPADQFRGDVTAGADISPRFSTLAQFFAIKGLRNGDAFDINNPNAQSDFDLYKIQLSILTTVTSTLRVQVGWNDSFSGRNTGRGHAAILAVWKSF